MGTWVKSHILPTNQSSRDSLYREVFLVLNRYGQLNFEEKIFVLKLICHKLDESQKKKGGGEKPYG